MSAREPDGGDVRRDDDPPDMVFGRPPTRPRSIGAEAQAETAPATEADVDAEADADVTEPDRTVDDPPRGLDEADGDDPVESVEPVESVDPGGPLPDTADETDQPTEVDRAADDRADTGGTDLEPPDDEPRVLDPPDADPRDDGATEPVVAESTVGEVTEVDLRDEPSSVPPATTDPAIAEPATTDPAIAEPAAVEGVAPDAEPDEDLIVVGAATASTAAGEAAPAPTRPGAAGGSLLGDAVDLRQRWETVQVGFVDDPRRAVEAADDMVAAAVAEVQAVLDGMRSELGARWRDDATSTDDLMTAFHAYRDVFERVLSV
jgi:hypothetical protein